MAHALHTKSSKSENSATVLFDAGGLKCVYIHVKYSDALSASRYKICEKVNAASNTSTTGDAKGKNASTADDTVDIVNISRKVVDSTTDNGVSLACVTAMYFATLGKVTDNATNLKTIESTPIDLTLPDIVVRFKACATLTVETPV